MLVLTCCNHGNVGVKPFCLDGTVCDASLGGLSLFYLVAEVIEYLKFACLSHLYATSISPPAPRQFLKSLHVLSYCFSGFKLLGGRGSELARIRENRNFFQSELQKMGFEFFPGQFLFPRTHFGIEYIPTLDGDFTLRKCYQIICFNKEVTEAIQKVAAAYDCKIVEGVLSHQLKQFVIDGNKVVLSVPGPETRVDDAELI